MSSVGTVFPRELLRVRDLVEVYRLVAGSEPVVRDMRQSIERAIDAWETADVVQIVRAYHDLREWY